jgi:hypothetical protein
MAPNSRRTVAFVEDDYLFPAGRADSRSAAKDARRARTERIKWPSSRDYNRKMIGEPKQDVQQEDIRKMKLNPTEPWSKREIYTVTRQLKTFHCRCGYCIDDVVRGKSGGSVRAYEYACGGQAEARRDYAAEIRPAAAVRRRSTLTRDDTSRAEDELVWSYRARDGAAVDALVDRAKVDHARRKDRQMEKEWTVLDGGREGRRRGGESGGRYGRGGSRSHSRARSDGWEVLSVASL